MEIKRKMEGEIPKSVSFNYDELKSYLSTELEKYKASDTEDMTPERYRALKDERAKLNSLSTAISGELTSLRKELLAPIDEKDGSGMSFKEKIKDLTETIEDVTETIQESIESYENALKEEKTNQVLIALQKKLHANGNPKMQVSPHWNRWTQEQFDRKRGSWLNATTTMQQVEDEIDAEIARCNGIVKIVESSYEGDGEAILKAALDALYAGDIDPLDSQKAATIAKRALTAEIEERQRKAKEESEQIENMAQSVELSEPMGSEGAKPLMYTCTIRFVGTEKAFQNLKEYLEINGGMTYKVVDQMREV